MGFLPLLPAPCPLASSLTLQAQLQELRNQLQKFTLQSSSSERFEVRTQLVVGTLTGQATIQSQA